MSAPKTDDLEAVRTVVDAVKDFKLEDQQRIFRWAAEKLGMSMAVPASSAAHSLPASVPGASLPATPAESQTGTSTDIKTFMAEKKPRNDVQYAAAAAYYYRFEAPQAERKDAINQGDLQEATRKSGRDRFSAPIVTLNNAHRLGLLDKGAERGTFTINSVGENLVAMTLPDGTPSKKPAGKKKTIKRRAAKKKGAKA